MGEDTQRMRTAHTLASRARSCQRDNAVATPSRRTVGMPSRRGWDGGSTAHDPERALARHAASPATSAPPRTTVVAPVASLSRSPRIRGLPRHRGNARASAREVRARGDAVAALARAGARSDRCVRLRARARRGIVAGRPARAAPPLPLARASGRPRARPTASPPSGGGGCGRPVKPLDMGASAGGAPRPWHFLLDTPGSPPLASRRKGARRARREEVTRMAKKKAAKKKK
jgi:hypothetical protein